MDEKVLYSNAMVLKTWTDRLFFVIIFNILFENIAGLEVFSENMVLSTLSQVGSLFFTILYGIYNLMMAGDWKRLLKWYGVVFIALAVICFGILTGGFTVFVLQLYVVAMLILSIIKIRYVRQTYNIYLNYLKIGGEF